MNELCVLDFASPGFLALDALGAAAWVPPDGFLQAAQAPPRFNDHPLEDLSFVTLGDRFAILRISGLIRAPSVAWSPHPGLEDLGETLLRLGAREDLREIVLHVTTSGGSIDYLEDFSGIIAAVSRHKRVRTFASGRMLSAGYWFGCQVEQVLCDALALIGGLGVFTVLIDGSTYAKEVGMRRIVVSSGGIKGMDFEDGVSDELKEEHQRLVLEQADLFQAAVRRGRGFSDDTLNQLFDGRSWIGESARSHGLVDRVLTFPAFRAELTGRTLIAFSTTLTPPNTNNKENETMSPESEHPSGVVDTQAESAATEPPAPALSESLPSAIGRAFAAAFQLWPSSAPTNTPPPEPPPAQAAVGDAERSSLLSACANELLVASGRQLAVAGVRLLPGHLKPGGAAESYAAAMAREILTAGSIDPASFPATSLASSRLGSQLTVEALFPGAPSVTAVAQAWGSLAQPGPQHQPNLATPTAATETLVPQGQAEPATGSDGFAAGFGTKSWAQLSADQRSLLEQEGMTPEAYAKYLDHVATSGGQV